MPRSHSRRGLAAIWRMGRGRGRHRPVLVNV